MLYRVGLGDLLGAHREGNGLRFDPCVSAEWERFVVRYRFGRMVYRIEFSNPKRVHRGVVRVSMDGKPLPNNALDLEDRGDERSILVELGDALPDGEQPKAQIGERDPVSRNAPA